MRGGDQDSGVGGQGLPNFKFEISNLEFADTRRPTPDPCSFNNSEHLIGVDGRAF